MNVKELRIGNLLNYCDQQTFVLELSVGNVLELGYYITSVGFSRDLPDDQIKPIELDEEWLIKLGFCSNKYKDEFTKKALNYIFTLDCEYTDNGVFNFMVNDMCLPPDIRYVHQVQNLYFTLTGNELEIK